MKKKYAKPVMDIIEMTSQTELLAGSGEDPWWKEPDEPEEGCQSAWWCGK